jgi:hypothetical protein
MPFQREQRNETYNRSCTREARLWLRREFFGELDPRRVAVGRDLQDEQEDLRRQEQQSAPGSGNSSADRPTPVPLALQQ